ncbi:unnamed protein product [Anisakis simplex]|uniref:Oxidoreductase n=1 Tax=Anisakis simplex TaxID=6269 RepID=A0A0M3K0R9_ANISI|nr:unnamed protein product [Anisakis simplex]
MFARPRQCLALKNNERIWKEEVVGEVEGALGGNPAAMWQQMLEIAEAQAYVEVVQDIHSHQPSETGHVLKVKQI